MAGAARPADAGEFPDYPSVIRDICASAGVAPEEIVIEELLQERLEEKASAFRQLDAGVLDMLSALLESGNFVTVANTTHAEVGAWDSCKLADLIEDPVFSFQVGAMEPEPAIYAEALRRVECTAPEAVFVGDGGGSEIAGPRRLGVEPIWATWFLSASLPDFHGTISIVYKSQAITPEGISGREGLNLTPDWIKDGHEPAPDDLP